jgi:hypothetical protein
MELHACLTMCILVNKTQPQDGIFTMQLFNVLIFVETLDSQEMGGCHGVWKQRNKNEVTGSAFVNV